jgi:hypothetical protein
MENNAATALLFRAVAGAQENLGRYREAIDSFESAAAIFAQALGEDSMQFKEAQACARQLQLLLVQLAMER